MRTNHQTGQLRCIARYLNQPLRCGTKGFYCLAHIGTARITLAFAKTKTQPQLVHTRSRVALTRIGRVKIVHGDYDNAMFFHQLLYQCVIGLYCRFSSNALKGKYRKEAAVWNGPFEVFFMIL